MKYSENNHRTNHSLRNLCSKLDTRKDINWLISICKKVGIVKLELDGSPIEGMKSSFLGKVEFNAKVISLLNVLKNNVNTLFVEKEAWNSFLLFYGVPLCKRLRGSDIALTSLSMTQINRRWVSNITYFFVYMKIPICLSMSSMIIWHSMKWQGKGRLLWRPTC